MGARPPLCMRLISACSFPPLPCGRLGKACFYLRRSWSLKHMRTQVVASRIIRLTFSHAPLLFGLLRRTRAVRTEIGFHILVIHVLVEQHVIANLRTLILAP